MIISHFIQLYVHIRDFHSSLDKATILLFMLNLKQKNCDTQYNIQGVFVGGVGGGEVVLLELKKKGWGKVEKEIIWHFVTHFLNFGHLYDLERDP